MTRAMMLSSALKDNRHATNDSRCAPPQHETPLRYFGGKSRGVPALMQFVPQDDTEVVSPFVGGASLELALTGRGIRVFGYDEFPPVVNFWQCMLCSPDKQDSMVRAVSYTHLTLPTKA